MTAPAAALLAAAVAAVCLTAGGPQALVTVAQRDANRSPRAARTADISADGRFVAFESRARLVAADVDDLHDIYVLDRTTSQVTLETAGTDDECVHPRISGDGRYVVYETRPSSAQKSPRADIALRDRVEGTTRVPVAVGAEQRRRFWLEPQPRHHGRRTRDCVFVCRHYVGPGT